MDIRQARERGLSKNRLLNVLQYDTYSMHSWSLDVTISNHDKSVSYNMCVYKTPAGKCGHIYSYN